MDLVVWLTCVNMKARAGLSQVALMSQNDALIVDSDEIVSADAIVTLPYPRRRICIESLRCF